jgi:tRNA A-37 threonylcarbamoyl transferase component Bud32
MDIISTDEFNTICQDSSMKVLKVGRGDLPKVMEKNGDTIIKIFYPKKSKFSSDRIWPRAMRFYKNVKRLQSNGYHAPEITKVQFCSDLKIYLLHYRKLDGQDVRSLVQSGQLHIIKEVAHLVANLHTQGIFFRSIHLENLLYQPDNKFALLDVADVRFKSKNLSLSIRYRNLKHLFLVQMDKPSWKAFGINQFMNEYFKHANLALPSRKLLSWFIQRL